MISGSFDAMTKGSSPNRMTPVVRSVATCISTHEMNRSRGKAIAAIGREVAHRVAADRVEAHPAEAHPAEAGPVGERLRKVHRVAALAPAAHVPLKAEILRGHEEQQEEEAAPGKSVAD